MKVNKFQAYEFHLIIISVTFDGIEFSAMAKIKIRKLVWSDLHTDDINNVNNFSILYLSNQKFTQNDILKMQGRMTHIS